jgi:sugar fermentation stimulation protein A
MYFEHQFIAESSHCRNNHADLYKLDKKLTKDYLPSGRKTKHEGFKFRFNRWAMKYNSHLTEAILLKRVLRFLGEIVLPNRQKLMIRCPNIGDMCGCDILGTKIWYSNAVGYHCLPTWELVEADGGFLVSINPELMKPLVIEAIKKNIITELTGYNIMHAGGQFDQFRSQFILLEKDQQQCYMGIEQVIIIGDKGVGLFPGNTGDGIENLNALIQARSEGHRAVLFYCVMNTGISYIKTQADSDSTYFSLLQQAVAAGVEMIAYRVTINLETIEITTQIPVLPAELVRSKSE